MVTVSTFPDPILREEPLGIVMVNGKSGPQLARPSLFVTLLLAAGSLTALAQNPPSPPAPNTQTGYTWDQIKIKCEAANPTLKADAINVDETKAQEITAYLRPNPQFTLSTDGTQIARYQGVWKPTAGTLVTPTFSYLHERDHKRELRLESAKEGTQIATSQHQDLERNLLFNLRSMFIQTMQAKAVLILTREELDYYDHIIDISRDRFKAG